MIVAIVFATTIVVTSANEPKKDIFVSKQSLTEEVRKQVECLADNIFFEAAYEPIDGQIAVASVTFNRMKSGHFPSDVCSVVKERNTRVCQFSWYCQQREKSKSYNKEKLLTKFEQRVYNELYDLSIYLYLNKHTIEDKTGGALFYHADYVRPNWRHLNKTVKIGRHIFYNLGDKDAKYDAETELRTEGRQQLAFVLSSDGRY